MQLATVRRDGSPRVNSVYYVTSEDNKVVYWLSEPGRRHSVDSLHDLRVGGAIAVKMDHPVAGLQFTGEASNVNDLNEVQIITARYNEKYDGIASGFYERLQAGTNKHHLYKMILTTLEIFDEVAFPGGKTVAVPLD